MGDDEDRQRSQRIAETTEIVLGVIDSYRRRDSEPKGPVERFFNRLTRNWVIVIFVIGLFTPLIGWLTLEISPLQPFEEIKARQDEYTRKAQNLEYRQRMVKRHIDLGNSFLNVGQLEAAHGEFENALKLAPDNSKAHFGKLKAEVFTPIAEREYDPEIAKLKLDLILTEREDDPQTLAFLGDVYQSISTEKALKYYNDAIKKDPSVAIAYAGIGLIHDKAGQIDDAIAMYEKALAISSWNQGFLNNLGYQYLRRNEYPKAIEKYTLLLQLDGRFLLTYYTLSNAYRLTGNLPKAMWIQERLLDLLDNTTITSLPRNRREWFFHTDTRLVHFYDLQMRKCYALYNAALTAYLEKDKAKASAYIAKAKALKSPDQQWVKILVRFDIQTIKNSQKQFAPAADGFAAKYL